MGLIISDMRFFNDTMDQLIEDFSVGKPVTGERNSDERHSYSLYKTVSVRCLVIDAVAEAELRKAISEAMVPGSFVVTQVYVTAGRFGFELQATIEEDTRVAI